MAIKLKRFLFFQLVFLFCSTLIGCGFKPRLPDDIPPYLHILYVDSPNPYDPLIVQLSRSLEALNVRLTKMKKIAPVTLRIINIKWEPLIPAILYSSATTPYTYLLSVDFDLETRNRKILMGPKNLTLRRFLIQNANQIYTPNATRLMKQEMTRTTASLIYKNLAIYGKAM